MLKQLTLFEDETKYKTNHNGVKFIDISKLPTTNLYKHKVIVVPFYTNQVVLEQVYEKLRG